MDLQQSLLEESHALDEQRTHFQNHNILFTKVTKFINSLKMMRQDEMLSNSQIDPFIAQNTSVDSQLLKLEKYIQENRQHFQSTNFDLFKIYKQITGLTLLKGFLLSLTNELLSASGIFMLDLATDQMKDFTGESNQKVLISAIFLGIVINYTVKNFVWTNYQWMNYRWQALCKTTLQYIIYKKSLKVKNYQKQANIQGQIRDKSESKEQKASSEETEEPTSFQKQNPDINNLLTVDVEESMELFWGINQLVASIAVIIITFSIIYYKIGKSTVNGLYLMAGAMAVSFLSGYFMNIFYDRIYSHKDSRISLCKDVIDGMKSIKYLGWQNIFSEKILNLRKKEFLNVAAMRSIDGIFSTFIVCSSYFLLYCFIVSYINDGNSLVDSNVFTIIALFGNLAFPIGMIPFSIKCLTKAKISFLRIKSFLNLDEIDESEVFQMNKTETQFAVQIKKQQFFWPNKEQAEDQNFNISQENASDLDNQVEDQEIFNNSNNQDFNLKIDNIQIQKGSLSFVIGKVGSGKTMFLLSILNEMNKKSQFQDPSIINAGSIEVDNLNMINYEKKIILNGNVAYVSQNHWLQTKTIRENILFGKIYNESLYNKCIEICQLQTDLSHFYKGDQKMISSDGNNLSGGQRQRISLCRAIYQDQDIYLLDDIFSSLDAHVAEYIYKNAIQDYLINQKKKTVILVTSNYDFISNENIQNIIYLKNGQIIRDTEQIQSYILKTKQTQKKNDFLFEEQFEGQSNKNIIQSEISDENQIQRSNQEINLFKYDIIHTPDTHDNNLSNKVNSNFYQNFLKKFKKYQVQLNKEEDQENEEYREKGIIKWETLKTYMRSQGIVYLIFFILFFALVEVASLIIDFWLRDKLIYQNEEDSAFIFINKHFSSFQQTFLFLTMLQLCLMLIGAFFYVVISLLSCYRLYNQLNRSIMQSKMVFFDKNPVGRIMSRLSDDINSIDDDLPLNFETASEQVVLAIGYPVGISIQFPWMSVFFIIAIVVTYFISNMYRSSSREVKRLNSLNKGQLLTHISESCKGLVTIRSFQMQAYMTQQYTIRLRNHLNSFLLSLSLQMWLFVRLLLISNGIQLILSITAIIIITLEASVDMNIIVLCLSYGILFSSQILDVVYFICQTEQELISVERVRQYFSNPQENLGILKSQNMLQNQQNLSAEDINQNFSIIFKDLSITYDELNSDSVEQALKNFNLKIRKGEKIAFCGRTGSGKTSILNCLFRLYDYQKGQIYIDNTDIHSMSLQELRQKMAIIPQFGFLYNATLRDNIDPISEIPDKDIQLCIESIQEEGCQLNSSDYFSDLNFEIQENGKNLSNGQKQILNFIRVALRETEIICLDEATSNMDPKTDELIHKKLFELSEGKTLLVITHRLENIHKFDRIVVLDSGKIVEIGNYEQLRQIQGGFFNRLISQKNKN